MEKMLHILLLYTALAVSNTTLFAANNLPIDITTDTCYAPAPDSFRITSVSSNFIALAWEPAWVGAEQTLSVLERNPTGAWEVFLPPFTVPGEAYTVGNLTPGVEYRFIIATNCGLGEPSYLKKKIDGITLILELTIGGRNPVNPVSVDCHNIHYLEHEWVGFKVETITKEGIHLSSLFELQPYGDINAPGFLTHVRIKRVDYPNPIVATNEYGKWPTVSQPVLLGPNPFRMGHKKPDGINSLTVGFIQLTNYSNSIDLCPDINNTEGPWRQSYEYTAMTAELANGIQTGNIEERGETQLNQSDVARVQCPFNEYLNVTLSFAEESNEISRVFLISATGKVILEKDAPKSNRTLTFQTADLEPGIYIIRIESSEKVSTLKTIKVK